MVAVASDVQKRSIDLSSKKKSKGPPYWHPGLGHVSGGVRGAFLAHFWLGKMGHFSRFFGFLSGPAPHLRGKNLISEAREWSQWLHLAKNVQFTLLQKKFERVPLQIAGLRKFFLGTQISKIFKLFSGPKIKLLRSWPDMSGGGGGQNWISRISGSGHVRPDIRTPENVRPDMSGREIREI